MTRAPQARLSINLNAEAVAFLDRVRAKRDISATEAIRRALSIYKLVEDAAEAGHEVQIDDGRSIRTLVIL